VGLLYRTAAGPQNRIALEDIPAASEALRKQLLRPLYPTLDAEPKPATVPIEQQVLVTREQACEIAGGISMDYLEKKVLPHVRSFRPGRRRLIHRGALELFLDQESTRAL